MDYRQVQSNMDAMINMFKSKMSEFEDELQQATSRRQPSTIAALNADFQGFKAFVCNALSILRAEVEALARGLDHLETRTRRKMLLVHGVPEEKNEDTRATVVATLTTKCKIKDLNSDKIRVCHRMGRPVTKAKGEAKSKPRPILIKFTDTFIRDRVWGTKKALKGTSVTLSEFLTRMRHDVFMAARDYFGVTSCWTRDGWILIKVPDGTRHRIESMAELLTLKNNNPKS